MRYQESNNRALLRGETMIKRILVAPNRIAANAWLRAMRYDRKEVVVVTGNLKVLRGIRVESRDQVVHIGISKSVDHLELSTAITASVENLTPYEKFHTYKRGWLVGCGNGCADPLSTNHPDKRFRDLYNSGWGDGVKARIAADTVACKRFKYKPTILRTQDAHRY